MILGLGHLLLLHCEDTDLFGSTELLVIGGTHVSLNIRPGRHVKSTLTSVTISTSTNASGHGGYFVSSIFMKRWDNGNKVKEINCCNVKVPFDIWDSQNVCLADVESVGIDAINEHAYLGFFINSIESVFHTMFSLVQVHKIMDGEASLIRIIGEDTKLDIKLGGNVSDIMKK